MQLSWANQIKCGLGSPTNGNETLGFRWISTKSWNFPLLDSSEARAAQLWASPRQVSGGELVAAAAVAIAGRLVGQRGELVAESGPAPPAAEEKPPVGCLLSNLQVNNHQAASQPLQEKSSAKELKKKKSLSEAWHQLKPNTPLYKAEELQRSNIHSKKKTLGVSWRGPWWSWREKRWPVKWWRLSLTRVWRRIARRQRKVKNASFLITHLFLQICFPPTPFQYNMVIWFGDIATKSI